MNTVLLVDADRELRSLLRALLTRRGHRVAEASTLAGARAKLPSADVVVLDVAFSDGTAEELLEQLSRARRAPVCIVCSSSVYAARLARRYHVAALAKFTLTAIADEVDRVIATRRRPRISGVSLPPESRPSLL
jgi:DNA-binding NtrC family response regulator